MKNYPVPRRPLLQRLPSGLVRARPRAYPEWKALRRWGKLPEWERTPSGHLLRMTREQAKLTQTVLSERIGCTQQAVAQAERWSSNPTIEFARRWAKACGAELQIELRDIR